MITAAAAFLRWLRPVLAELLGAVSPVLPLAATLGLGGSAVALAGRLLSLGAGVSSRPPDERLHARAGPSAPTAR